MGHHPQASQGGASTFVFQASSYVQGSYTSVCLLGITLEKDLSGMPHLRCSSSPVQGNAIYRKENNLQQGSPNSSAYSDA